MGVLAFQVPADEINNVMTGNQSWQQDGLGILLEPEPEVFTLNYEDSAVSYEVKLFIRDYGDVERNGTISQFHSQSARFTITMVLPASRRASIKSLARVCRQSLLSCQSTVNTKAWPLRPPASPYSILPPVWP